MFYLIKIDISIDQYRLAIGSFYSVKFENFPRNNVIRGMTVTTCLFSLISMTVILLLFLSNDIELYPGPNNSTTHHFKIGFCNIRGMRTNLLTLKAFLNMRFDVFRATETMLSELVHCNKLKIDGYQMPFRRDRDCHCGGLIVYISNYVNAKKRTDDRNPLAWTEYQRYVPVTL